MASSGTYAVDYDISEFTEDAFERCGIDPATLTARHMRSARRSLNLLFAKWSNDGVRLFHVDEQTQTLADGTASYSAAAGTLAILEVVVRRNDIDTPVHLIDREQYHMIPSKTQEGLPSMLYYDRGANTYYLWNTPENSTDQLRYYRLRRFQDVTAGAETADVPYTHFEALVSGLAEFLAIKFAPDRFDMLSGIAAVRLKEAMASDRQRTDTSFSMGW